jgi:protein TonB
MFQDALMESSGKLSTRSRYFAVAGLAINAFILLALILWPLLHPLGLPKQALEILLTAPAPPHATAPVTKAMAKPVATSQNLTAQLLAPSTISTHISTEADAAPLSDDVSTNFDAMTDDGTTSAIGDILKSVGTASRPVVHVAPPKTIPVSSGVMAGNKISGADPIYPAIGRNVRIQGTVVISATISKSGTIENLHVLSGPPMLVSSALEAVQTWRYRPYLLNGEPVEVETTINVVYNLGN